MLAMATAATTTTQPTVMLAMAHDGSKIVVVVAKLSCGGTTRKLEEGVIEGVIVDDGVSVIEDDEVGEGVMVDDGVGDGVMVDDGVHPAYGSPTTPQAAPERASKT